MCIRDSTDTATKKIAYGPIQPAYKDFLAEMAKWYAEGLIDKEYISTDGQTAQSKLMQNLSGAALDFTSGINNYNVGLQAVNVDGNYIGAVSYTHLDVYKRQALSGSVSVPL